MLNTNFSWLLFSAFTFLFLLSYMPVRQLVKLESENILLTYYMSISVRFMLAMIFLVLGADIELLYGIAIGIVVETTAMYQISQSQEASSHEVFCLSSPADHVKDVPYFGIGKDYSIVFPTVTKEHGHVVVTWPKDILGQESSPVFFTVHCLSLLVVSTLLLVSAFKAVKGFLLGPSQGAVWLLSCLRCLLNIFVMRWQGQTWVIMVKNTFLLL